MPMGADLSVLASRELFERGNPPVPSQDVAQDGRAALSLGVIGPLSLKGRHENQ